MKNGPYISYFQNEVVFKIQTMVNNKTHGEQMTFTIDGKISSTSMFDLGVKHGAAKSYHENGTQCTDENWVDGELDGTQRSYYSNGQLGICSDYTVGVRNGDHLEYFQNGRPKFETHLFQGKVVGTHRQYMNNEDSTVIFEAEYLDGILEGKIRMLNKSTLAIALEGIVSDLKKTLKLFKYFTNGKMDTQLQVDLTTGQGYIRRYWSNGQIY
jgi:antitoxin component YwqK of YwqJK toxin-antitoxin module